MSTDKASTSERRTGSLAARLLWPTSAEPPTGRIGWTRRQRLRRSRRRGRARETPRRSNDSREADEGVPFEQARLDAVAPLLENRGSREPTTARASVRGPSRGHAHWGQRSTSGGQPELAISESPRRGRRSSPGPQHLRDSRVRGPWAVCPVRTARCDPHRRRHRRHMEAPGDAGHGMFRVWHHHVCQRGHTSKGSLSLAEPDRPAEP